MIDEVELVRELRAELPGARDASRAAARAALLERIEAAGGPAPSSRRSVRPGPGRRRLVIAVGAIVLGVVVASALLLGRGEAGVQSAAAEVLRREAGIAAALTPEAPPAGQHLFIRTKEAHLAISFREGPRVAARIRRHLRLHPDEGARQRAWWAYVPVERTMWLDPEGLGRIREVRGRARFLSARQRHAWVLAGSPPLPRAGRIVTRRFGSHGLPGIYFSRFSRLPTDPQELRRWIEEHDVPGGSMSTAGTTSTGLRPVKSGQARTFGAVGFLLGESFAPPALRAALYEVASGLPGVQLLGRVADPVGREGVGVAYTDRRHGERLELIFDPTSSTLLGERWVVTSPRRSGIAVPPGTAVGYTAQLTSRVVG